MKLFIVRHGETIRNKDKNSVVTGPVGLNEVGQQQARAVSERLREEKIDYIFSSHLLRAVQTADSIATFHPKAQRIIDEHIREQRTGVLSTKTVAERDEAQRASGNSFRDWRTEGGESLRDVKDRASTWFTQLRQKYMDKAVVVVSHGFFLYTLLEVVIEDGADVEREDFALSNGGLTELVVHPEGHVTVVHLNNITHLGDIPTLQSHIATELRNAKK